MKKISYFIAVLVMAISLASCGPEFSDVYVYERPHPEWRHRYPHHHHDEHHHHHHDDHHHKDKDHHHHTKIYVRF